MGQLCIKMDKDSVMRNNTTTNNNNNIRGGGEATSSFLRPSIDSSRQQATTSSDFGFQWGNRKRLRCMKIQVKDKDKDHDSTGPVHRTTVRVDRRVVRADKDSSNSHPSNNGYLNLRHRPSSSPPPPPQRILRYTHFDLKSLCLSYFYVMIRRVWDTLRWVGKFWLCGWLFVCVEVVGDVVGWAVSDI